MAERGRAVLKLASRSQPSTKRVYLLMYSPDGADGVSRTVLNLANSLVARHQVEVIGLYRRRLKMAYEIDPAIEVGCLEDARPRGPKGQPYGGRVLARDAPERSKTRALLDRQPSRLVPQSVTDMSALTDLLFLRKLRTLQPGVLISTRPSLHAVAAKLTPRHVITVAQDHLNYESRASSPNVLHMLEKAGHRLDSLVLLTEGDVPDYQRLLRGSDTLITAIPNALPWPVDQAAPLTDKVIVAAGRLVERKGFARLLKAYEPVARRHRDWQLHIYGKGDRQAALEQQVESLGLTGQVVLQGHSDRFDEVLTRASLFASGSHAEGFPMVMIEALSKGVPLVSFDCPRGPGEIIEDGVNGRLVPDGDLAAFTGALFQLVEDDGLRRRMGAAALETARRYEIGRVTDRWESLFEDLLKRRLSG